jgi:predicted RNase H-like HicB family nuclease
MLTEWVQAAMRKAEYKLIDSDPPWFAAIPECDGVWAVGATVEECRAELHSTLEGWLLLGLQLGHPIPVVDGIDLAMQVEPLVYG